MVRLGIALVLGGSVVRTGGIVAPRAVLLRIIALPLRGPLRVGRVFLQLGMAGLGPYETPITDHLAIEDIGFLLLPSDEGMALGLAHQRERARNVDRGQIEDLNADRLREIEDKVLAGDFDRVLAGRQLKVP